RTAGRGHLGRDLGGLLLGLLVGRRALGEMGGALLVDPFVHRLPGGKHRHDQREGEDQLGPRPDAALATSGAYGSSNRSVRHLADPPAFMNSESGVCTTSNFFAPSAFT